MRHLEAGRSDRAAQLLTKLSKKAPDDPSVLHFLGVAHYRCGRFAEAIEILDKATRVAPDYPEAANSHGTVLLETRRFAEARAQFERAVALRPDYVNAHTNLGDSLRAEGDLAAAVAAFEQALRFDPRHVPALHKLASTRIMLGRIADALSACDACLAVDPYCQNALAAKALALQVNGDDTGAEALYDFDRLVRPVHLEPPDDFDSLTAFNEALAKAVRREPSLTWEPLNRVTRSGAVTQDMLARPSRVIRAFAASLGRSIDAYRDSLAPDPSHPFLSRLPARYRLTLIASILTEGGWHPPHIHESAWLSGVYYVQLPEAITASAGGEQGWLEFGRPDYALPDAFEPACTRQRPEAGLALFFPSYFFHGTIAFDGAGERIGIAFDAFAED